LYLITAETAITTTELEKLIPGATIALGIFYLGKLIEKPLEPAVNSVTLTRQASSKYSRELDEQNTQSIVQED
jgi:hypothetical protein